MKTGRIMKMERTMRMFIDRNSRLCVYPHLVQVQGALNEPGQDVVKLDLETR